MLRGKCLQELHRGGHVEIQRKRHGIAHIQRIRMNRHEGELGHIRLALHVERVVIADTVCALPNAAARRSIVVLDLQKLAEAHLPGFVAHHLRRSYHFLAHFAERRQKDRQYARVASAVVSVLVNTCGSGGGRGVRAMHGDVDASCAVNEGKGLVEHRRVTVHTAGHLETVLNDELAQGNVLLGVVLDPLHICGGFLRGGASGPFSDQQRSDQKGLVGVYRGFVAHALCMHEQVRAD
mmetsp:Transcript_62483/g.110210  ORF Transcript_62483/g.110210 Transcript_62483/m.110210 type:complete len:237 (+) Transcript_62483:350-1060(+)